MTPQEYAAMFDGCRLLSDPTRVLATRAICKRMLANQITYWGVEKTTGIPWLVIAAIHFRESSQNFRAHLHNGDPLTGRTTHVPAGRPATGLAPFTWTASAIDALSDRKHPFAWDVGTALEFCENYNGHGYDKHGVNSPYLWAGTDKYCSGLFVADGSFDPEKKDARPGVVALFKTLMAGGVPLDFIQAVAPHAALH